MRLTNLEFGKYTNMSEKERQDYADAWLYIHRKKGKITWQRREEEKREEVDVRRLYFLYLKSCCC